MSKKLDLVARGHPVMDILCTRKGRMEKPGGSSATVAVTVSKLGLSSGLIGQVGKDDYGRQLIEELEKAGVDILRLRRKGYTTVNKIRITPNNREILKTKYYTPIELDEEDTEYIRQAGHLFTRARSGKFSKLARFAELTHVNIYTSLQRFIERTYFDRNALYSPAIKIIFSSEDEMEDWITKLEEKLIIVTQSKKGCTVFYNTKSRRSKQYFLPYTVKAVDPTGAGDVFAGAFIFGHLNEWLLAKTARYANMLAALTTTQYGSRTFIMNYRRDL